MEREAIGTIKLEEEWMYYDHSLIGVFNYENQKYIGMFLENSSNQREEIWLLVPADQAQIEDRTLSMKAFYENSLSYFLFELDCIHTEVFLITSTTKEAIMFSIPEKYEITFR